jgi:hypothetical protein
MSNGGNGQHNDSISTLLLSAFAFVSWLLRFAVGRYFNRKDKIEEEKRRERELKQLLEGTEHRHKHHK